MFGTFLCDLIELLVLFVCIEVLSPVEGCKGKNVASVSAYSLNIDSMLTGVCSCGDCSILGDFVPKKLKSLCQKKQTHNNHYNAVKQGYSLFSYVFVIAYASQIMYFR